MAAPIDLTVVIKLNFERQELRQVNNHCIDINSGFNQTGHKVDILRTTVHIKASLFKNHYKIAKKSH